MKTIFCLIGLIACSNVTYADCSKWDAQQNHDAPRVQIKAERDTQVHFLKEPKACPATGNCANQENAYLLNGDVAYQVSTQDSFTCVAYVKSSGKAIVGWMPKSSLETFTPWSVDAATKSQAYPIRWSAKLSINSQKEIVQKLAASFSDAFQGNGKTPVKITNCNEAIERQKDYDGPNVDYKVFLSQLADCYTLKTLASLKASKTSFVNDFEFNQKSLNELPAGLDLLISDDSVEDAAKADKKGMPLSKFEEGYRVSSFNPMQISFGDKDSSIDLELLAKGDYDGDGIEDLVVKQTTGTSGTYGSSHLFILTRTGSKQVLKHIKDF